MATIHYQSKQENLILQSNIANAVVVQKKSIGLLVMATGRYIDYIPKLLQSADTYFCPEHNVTYFVFTDGQLPATAQIKRPVVTVYQSQLGWPYDSMMRAHTYFKHRNLFAGMDYLFACDADMYFADTVGDEMLGERVATLHPNYILDKKPYETHPLSMACVNRGEGTHYFAGALYGGSHDAFIQLLKTITTNIDIDLSRGVIARINDESYLNRYLIDHAPTTILSPSYCYFEHDTLPYPKKIIAIDGKPESSIRTMATISPLDYYRTMLVKNVVNQDPEQEKVLLTS